MLTFIFCIILILAFIVGIPTWTFTNLIEPLGILNSLGSDTKQFWWLFLACIPIGSVVGFVFVEDCPNNIIQPPVDEEERQKFYGGWLSFFLFFLLIPFCWFFFYISTNLNYEVGMINGGALLLWGGLASMTFSVIVLKIGFGFFKTKCSS